MYTFLFSVFPEAFVFEVSRFPRFPAPTPSGMPLTLPSVILPRKVYYRLQTAVKSLSPAPLPKLPPVPPDAPADIPGISVPVSPPDLQDMPVCFLPDDTMFLHFLQHRPVQISHHNPGVKQAPHENTVSREIPLPGLSLIHI